MAELGRGGIERSFTAVCGGCARRLPLPGVSTESNAILRLIAEGWGEDPTIGLICKACTRRQGEAMAKAAKETRERASAIILTDVDAPLPLSPVPEAQLMDAIPRREEAGDDAAEGGETNG